MASTTPLSLQSSTATVTPRAHITTFDEYIADGIKATAECRSVIIPGTTIEYVDITPPHCLSFDGAPREHNRVSNNAWTLGRNQRVVAFGGLLQGTTFFLPGPRMFTVALCLNEPLRVAFLDEQGEEVNRRILERGDRVVLHINCIDAARGEFERRERVRPVPWNGNIFVRDLGDANALSFDFESLGQKLPRSVISNLEHAGAEVGQFMLPALASPSPAVPDPIIQLKGDPDSPSAAPFAFATARQSSPQPVGLAIKGGNRSLSWKKRRAGHDDFDQGRNIVIQLRKSVVESGYVAESETKKAGGNDVECEAAKYKAMALHAPTLWARAEDEAYNLNSVAFGAFCRSLRTEAVLKGLFDNKVAMLVLNREQRDGSHR